VELEAFTRELLRVADEEVLREFQLELAARPEAGDLIRHSGRVAQSQNETAGAREKRWRAGDLPVAAAGAAIYFLHALHEINQSQHRAGRPGAVACRGGKHQATIQPMKKTEIAFDINELVGRVERFAAGKERARVRRVTIPPPVKAISARAIRETRAKLGCTQSEFAALLNVPKVTAVSWENGTRKPSGAALRLLAVARKNPDALQAA
jgi:putative transcriptional regulator